MASDNHSTGHIVSNADDLLTLSDADYGQLVDIIPRNDWDLRRSSGILVIGEGAKILGPTYHGQEILVMGEYLRMKQFEYVFHPTFWYADLLINP